MGQNPEPGAPRRGRLDLPSTVHVFKPHSPPVIVQHPQGFPVKPAPDTDAVIGLNGNGTRVTYRTNTEPGSSGSPCFDINLNPAALHHAGEYTIIAEVVTRGDDDRTFSATETLSYTLTSAD